MYLPITSIFASIFGLLIIWLTIKVSLLRIKHKAALGPINNDEYLRRNSALSNLTANLPIFLILLALAETAHICWLALACIGAAYLLARLAHIYSLYRYELKTGRIALRSISMMGTFLVIIILAAINLYLSYCAFHHYHLMMPQTLHYGR